VVECHPSEVTFYRFREFKAVREMSGK